MIQLQPFTEKNFEQLKSWINTPELMQSWAGSLFSFPLSDNALHWYIEDTNEIGVSEAFVFAVVETDTNEVIGHISLGNISFKNNSGRITRVFIDPIHQGRGFCKQMTKLILQFGFEQLKLHRISLGVYTQNESAIRCYKSSGMKSEGIQRDCLKFENEWWSSLEMSMLSDEWFFNNC